MIKDDDYTISENGCWIWSGKKCSSGRYGYFYRGKGMQMAHRASYEKFKGKIGRGLFVCHTCDNGLCINPDHLFLGTNSDNMKDAFSKGRLNLNNKDKFGKCGEENFHAKLSEPDVLEIREFYKNSKCSYGEIVRRFNLKSQGHARAIVKRLIWTHI